MIGKSEAMCHNKSGYAPDVLSEVLQSNFARCFSTKLAQSRETPLAAAASRHQAANYRSLTSVALFFTGIVVESRDRWMFRRSPPRPTLGL